MREIKFRGKRVDNGEWVEGFLFVSQMSGCFILLSKIDIKKHRGGETTMGDKLEQYEVIPETVGQYTGLKDKNGVEIYEGDIIKTYYNVVAPVEWDESGLWCICFTEEHPEGGTINRRDYIPGQCKNKKIWCEVIGNVHDNPSLLGGA